MDPRSHHHEHDAQHDHHHLEHLYIGGRGHFARSHGHGRGPGMHGGRREGGFGRRGRGGFGLDPDAPMGRGPRRGRGDVRTAVLMLLVEQPMHGYEMIQQIRERSADAWSPSPGAIYPTIQLLTDEGLIITDEIDGKKVSRLTEAGRIVAAELAATKSAPWDDASSDAGDGAHSLRQAVFHLMSAAKQMAMAGTDAQRQRTTELLDEARKKIYALLASDEA